VPSVSALRATKRGRIALYLDGEFACIVTEALIARYRLFAGKELSTAEAEALRAEAARARVLADAHRLLGHRSRSRAEVRRRLLQKEHDVHEVDGVLDRLVRDGLLDDAAFARAFAADKRRLSGWGSERIARALREAGVSEEHIQAALAATAAEGSAGVPTGAGEPDVDEAELARALAALRRRGRATPPLDAAKARAFQFLRRRGYATHVAYDAVRLWATSESDDGH
jgi:regulatory protein